MNLTPEQVADKIIADYLEHYDFPTQGESHMHDCITSALSQPKADQPAEYYEQLITKLTAGIERCRSTLAAAPAVEPVAQEFISALEHEELRPISELFKLDLNDLYTKTFVRLDYWMLRALKAEGKIK